MRELLVAPIHRTSIILGNLVAALALTALQELANAIYEWTECWYNPTRRHSSLGMLSPADFETRLRPPDHGA